MRSISVKRCSDSVKLPKTQSGRLQKPLKWKTLKKLTLTGSLIYSVHSSPSLFDVQKVTDALTSKLVYAVTW